jgi:KaiC/GvpD/RAD55 family RecA-like ATPase
MLGPRIAFVLMLILALIPAASVIPTHASSGPSEVTSTAGYVYGPERFSLTGVCLATIKVELNAARGQQFHIQWTTTTQSERGLDFYIGTRSFNLSPGLGGCHLVGNPLYSQTGANGSVDWLAPSIGQYVFWLVNDNSNYQPVSGTFSIQTSNVATASSVTSVSTSSTNFVSATVTSQVSTATPSASIQATTTRSSTEQIAASQTTTSQPNGAEQVGGFQVSFGNLGFVAVGAVAAVVASVLVFARRRKPAPAGTSRQASTTTVQEPQREAVTTQSVTQAKPTQPQPTIQKPPRIISTGYLDLDRALEGGIREKFAVVIVSPSYDERDLLLRKIVDSALGSGRLAILVSNDIGRTEDLTSRYTNGFYSFSSQADKVSFHGPNLVKLPGIENLSDANLSLSLAIKDAIAKENRSKPIIILDILSDVLLRHKSVTTRRWLSDFVGKRKAEGSTIVATLNPLATSKEETQGVIDFFDGVIEIFEKTLTERTRRFLIIRKMYGQRYSESEVLMDKDKLF